MAFFQPDDQNTLSEILRTIDDVQPGATVIGLLSIVVLLVWSRWKPLKSSPIPAPLVVVLLGVGMNLLFRELGGIWEIESSHLVQVPVAEKLTGFLDFLQMPDFSQWSNPAIYTSAVTLAIIASLETLLNLEAVDKLDPLQRNSPPSRELLAQGIGNVVAGMIGGLPVTSVIVRSSVNINAGGKTKLSAIVHSILLLVSVAFFPVWLNLIPLSCLAAILLVTGVKLASPALVKQMWSAGRYQFVPFALTVVAIVLTDLLIGILIGLAVSLLFILNSNLRRPIRSFLERHLGGDVLHIELANQVSFLNRAALVRVLDGIPRGGHVLLDAQNTDYIDPDVLDLFRDFKEKSAPARGVELSLVGFRQKYQLQDLTQYVDYSTRELQEAITPEQVLQILKDGHERFRTGRRLTRNFTRQIGATADGQHPLAVILSCIDSRSPAELIFDLGMGDILSVRIAGNVTSRKVLASIEYGCAVAGAKLILVMGHTRCGAVTAAVNLICSNQSVADATGCQHLDFIVSDIQMSTDLLNRQGLGVQSESEMRAFIDATARRNVIRVVDALREQSQTIRRLAEDGRIAVVGAMYDVTTGDIEFLSSGDVG
jgi:carbonic anhydrase/SulP family sulfate permease